ncbi:MAG: hypothetical protein KF819_33605 [Labilithrix sp.]|nr:hypothetical protein [Labilithrix sp.]
MDKARAIVIAAVTLVALAASGCVKDDPIVTGKRDAAAAPVVRQAVVPKNEDTADEDAPDCRTCGDTLDTTKPRGTLCRKNHARPSVVILNELVDCLCLDKCIGECASYCSGATREGTCLPCITNNCGDLLTECGQDVVPGQ